MWFKLRYGISARKLDDVFGFLQLFFRNQRQPFYG